VRDPKLAKAFDADAHAIESWRKHWTSEGLSTYERLLTRRVPAPFALGDEPGLADICIAGQVIAAQFFKTKPGRGQIPVAHCWQSTVTFLHLPESRFKELP